MQTNSWAKRNLILVVFFAILCGVFANLNFSKNYCLAESTGDVVWRVYHNENELTNSTSDGEAFEELDIGSGAQFDLGLFGPYGCKIPAIKLTYYDSSNQLVTTYYVPMASNASYCIKKIQVDNVSLEFSGSIDYTRGQNSLSYQNVVTKSYNPDESEYEEENQAIELQAEVAPINYKWYVPYVENDDGDYDGVAIEFNTYGYTALPTSANFSVSGAAGKIKLPDGADAFSHWLIESRSNKTWNDVTYDIFSYSSDTLTISKSGLGEFRFHVVETISVNGKSYYKVDKVKGSGKLQSLLTLSDPVVRAQWLISYDTRVDAGQTVWTTGEYKDEIKPVGLVSNESRFSIVSRDNSIGFANNVEHAFDGITVSGNGKSYTIKNYGYEVGGYSIKVEYGGNQTIWLRYNGTWSTSASLVTSSISQLGEITLGDLAGYLDSNFAFTLTNKPVITITAQNWQAASIKLTCMVGASTGTQTGISYNSDYALSLTGLNQPAGKSYYYKSGDVVIANDGKWNYVSLSSYQYSSNVYNLNLTAYELDNVYKVRLTNLDTDYDKNSLTNESLHYYTNGIESAVSLPDVYTYKDIAGLTIPTYTSGIMDYPTNTSLTKRLNDYFETYTQSITGSFKHNQANLNIFKTVYKIGEDRYIYLANAKEYGDLPQFRSSKFITIAYNNSTSTFSFVTALFDENSVDMGTKICVSNNTFDHKWNLQNNNDRDLRVVGYEKYLNLVLDTQANGESNMYGYAHIKISNATDERFYTALYVRDNDPTLSKVQFYKGNGSYPLLNSIGSMTPEGYVRVGFGENITIIQLDEFGYPLDSNTIFATANSDFNQMIGYTMGSIVAKLMQENDSASTEISIISGAVYSYQSDGGIPKFANIEAGNYDTLSVILNYSKINYELQIQMEDYLSGKVVSGTFDVTRDNDNFKTERNINYRLTMSVNDIDESKYFYIVKYNPSVGFKLSNFVGSGLVTSGNETSINITADWLKTYLYNNVANRDKSHKNLPGITVNTEAIEYDLSYMWLTGNQKHYQLIDKFKLTEYDPVLDNKTTAGKTLIGPIATSPRLYYQNVFVDGNVDYALLSSALYYPSEGYLNTYGNYYRTYAFPLDTAPSEQFEIDSEKLSKMLIGNDIYIYLNIKPISKIVVNLENDLYAQDNNLDKTLRIYYNINDRRVVVVDDENIVGELTLLSSEVGKSYEIYSYEDIDLQISTTLNQKIYDSLNIENNGGELDGIKFSLTGSSLVEDNMSIYNLDISWDYKDLELQKFVTKIDKLTGVESPLPNADEILQKVDPYLIPEETLTYAKTFVLDYNTLSDQELNELGLLDYAMVVKINKRLNLQPLDEITINADDYNVGAIQLTIQFVPIEGYVTVEYELVDGAATPDDDFGYFTVRSQMGRNGSSFYIPNGQPFEIDINGLNNGYRYVGVTKYGSISLVKNADGGIIRVYDSFDNNLHTSGYGSYKIMVEKVEYNLNLIVGESFNSSAYKILDGKTTVKVNETIKLSNPDLERERLNSYYNLDYSESALCGYVNGSSEVSFRFTQAMVDYLVENNLTTFDIYTNIDTKHKLTYSINGENLIDKDLSIIAEHGGLGYRSYISGTYTLSDTIDFTIFLASDHGKTGEYLQTRYSLIIDSVEVNFGDLHPIDISAGDKAIEITIVPKAFAPNFTVYAVSSFDVYMQSQEEDEGDARTQITDITPIDISTLRTSYGDTIQVKFKLEAELGGGDHVLTKITIGNQTFDYTDETVGDNTYVISRVGDYVFVNYIVEDEMDIVLEYTILKSVSPLD